VNPVAGPVYPHQAACLPGCLPASGKRGRGGGPRRGGRCDSKREERQRKPMGGEGDYKGEARSAWLPQGTTTRTMDRTESTE